MDKNAFAKKINYFEELKNFIPKILLLGFTDSIVVHFGTILINSEIISFKDSFVISIYLMTTCILIAFIGGLAFFPLLYIAFYLIRPSVILRGLLERYFFLAAFTVIIFSPFYNRLAMNYSYYSVFSFADTYYKMAFLLGAAVLILAVISIAAALVLTLMYQVFCNIISGLLGRWQIVAGIIIIYVLSAVSPVLLNRNWSETSMNKLNQKVNLQDYGKKNSVFLVGIDGATWTVIDPLLKKDKLPNFKYLIDNGVRSDIKTSVPTHSPILWTSIATGQKPDKHGIKSFIMIFFSGAKTPIQDMLQRGFFSRLQYLQFTGLVNVYPANTYYRKTPAIWNILSREGKKSIIVNWFPSWPAEDVDGYMISDKFIRTVTSDKELHRDPCRKYNNLVYPDYLCIELSKNMKSYLSEDLNKKEYISDFQKLIYQSENIYFNMSLELLLKEEKTDFFTVYLRGTDDLEHKYWKYRDSDKIKFPYVTQEERKKYESVIDDYYVQIDSYMGEIIKRMDENSTVIVISDHGHEAFFTGLDSKQNGAHGLGPDGIFIASGKNIAKNFSGDKPTIYDITPTILYLLGSPVADDMDGRVLENIIDKKMFNENPPRFISTYYRSKDKKPAKEKDNDNKSMGDEKLMNKLKALGYIN